MRMQGLGDFHSPKLTVASSSVIATGSTWQLSGDSQPANHRRNLLAGTS